ALAEYAVAKEGSTVPRPPEVSAPEAAALPIAGLAAHQSLTQLAGGVGQYAVQLLKLANAHITATCGARNMDLVRSLGADEVLDYKTPDGVALRSPSGRKYDVIIHCAHNIPWSTFEANLTSKGKVVNTTPGICTVMSAAAKTIKCSKKQLIPLFTSPNKAEVAWAKSIDGHATGKILVE
ncbi:hypothetical protein Goklo_023495, partial [Gossypium klotzschianum]|nr:hypothetical protein [Gossypium klotzschianum]